ncbi:hypothetical protein E2562_022300 [Oryza meyeriana var. granulata]|uniref:Uncharacterized protein n=1 Tax=Oryza meyeriana var. granulata TaxID=110450 RepID=A0A6G1D669_9ORYZ|nr:hypothetical protein E2562_022300 [Oryza meyeriana var. granulata]
MLHWFMVHCYLLTMGMGVGKHIASETFSVEGLPVGGVYCYPDGENPEDNCACVSVLIAPPRAPMSAPSSSSRCSTRAARCPRSTATSTALSSPGPTPPSTVAPCGVLNGSFGEPLSRLLKDDCLKINCTELMLFLMWRDRDSMPIHWCWLQSTVFRLKFFHGVLDGEKNEASEGDALQENAMDDMGPNIFKVCPCFLC